MSDAEDANEMLFYIQDIFNIGDYKLNRILINTLLQYAFLPNVVKSLCDLQNAPTLSLNTSLYVLIQTFRIIKEKAFINLLFSALFLPNLPQEILDRVVNVPDAPQTYSQKFQYKNYSQYSLKDHILEFYNTKNIDLFLLHCSQQQLLKNIKIKYEKQISQLQQERLEDEEYQAKLLVEEQTAQEDDEFFDCKSDEEEIKIYEIQEKMTLQKDEIQLVKLQQIKADLQNELFSLIQVEDQQNIRQQHLQLSLGLGLPKSDQLKEEPVNNCKNTLLSFLRSKDDNLLLLVGGLIVSAINNNVINPRFIKLVSEICPRRFIKQQIEGDSEDQTFSYPRYHQLINRLIEVIEMDPPFRTFTTRIYIKLLLDLCPPQSGLFESRYLKRLLSTYKNSIQHLKKMVYLLNPENYLDPFYYFMEIFQTAVKNFKEVNSVHEFYKLLSHPLLMCPYLTEELQKKMPVQLYQPMSREEESANQAFFTQELVMKRWLVHEYAKGLGLDGNLILKESKKYEMITSREFGQATHWEEGKDIDVFPSDTKYFTCFQKYSKFSSDQILFLADENYLLFLKPSNQPSKLMKPYQSLMNKLPDNIYKSKNSNYDYVVSQNQSASFGLPFYGYEDQPTFKVLIKQKFKQVIETMLDPKDFRNLRIYLVDKNEPDGYRWLEYQFENGQIAQLIKDQFIDEKKRNQMINEKHVLENFLIEECEKELFQLLVAADDQNQQ
ncbi:UNKNOWN [Stylonychia lemnae]|uniref:FPL domain-containing protein n=1 Tax=Stylonychia lemnae TaxID=5949 RepID=A0A078AZ28_STYLE|nr:UNKNOWN [Stylonychia lemnae]|eukprot:CDW86068.1 UNKNOWN [Stylonychia lemnae]